MNEHTQQLIGQALTIRWGTSRGRNSYGYTTCSLRDDTGKRRAMCNGGGYDLRGTVIGNWIASEFPAELVALTPEIAKSLGGLTYHNPNYDPGKAVIGKDCHNRTMGGADGKTVEQAEADGESLGLERYQAFYGASSPIPTDMHTIPLLDGGCGESAMMKVLRALGLSLHQTKNTSTYDVYTIAPEIN